jgi:hypothetical protein
MLEEPRIYELLHAAMPFKSTHCRIINVRRIIYIIAVSARPSFICSFLLVLGNENRMPSPYENRGRAEAFANQQQRRSELLACSGTMSFLSRQEIFAAATLK